MAYKNILIVGIFAIFAFLILFFVSNDNSPHNLRFPGTGTNIDNCQALSSAGTTYALTSNPAQNSSTCFNITAANVTLDCAGYSITGNNASNTYGVYTNSTNSTIKNCIISNFSDAIQLDGSNISSVTNNTLNITFSGGSGIFFGQNGVNDSAATIYNNNITAPVWVNNSQGNDNYTVLLLHMDGANGGTTFTDSSQYAHLMTANGNADTNTTSPKFGTAKGYFDGTGDYLNSSISSDFTFANKDFTIDFWYYTGANGTLKGLIAKGDSAATTYANGDFYLSQETNNTISFTFDYSGNNAYSAYSTSALTSNTYTHVAVVRNSTRLYIFINGSLQANISVGTATMNDVGTPLVVGRWGNYNGHYMAGYIDELRVSKGVARWTGAFTPPTRAYGGDNTNYFNSSSQGNIYYFTNGTGSWNVFDIVDTSWDNWADSGTARPFSNSTVGGNWTGSGADWFPFTNKSTKIPVITAISISPATTAQNITCNITAQSNRTGNQYADVSWLLNNTNKTALHVANVPYTNNTNMTVATLYYAGNTSANDNWSCKVFVFDSQNYSVANLSANVTITSSGNPDLNCILQTGITSIIFHPSFGTGVSANLVYPVNQTNPNGTYSCTNNGTGNGNIYAMLNDTLTNVSMVASCDYFSSSNLNLTISNQSLCALSSGQQKNISFYRNYTNISTTEHKTLAINLSIG